MVLIEFQSKGEMYMYPKIVAICGMPGSGKGEVSKLANQNGIPVLSMGDMIRAEAERRGLEETPGNIGLVVVSLRSQFGEQILAERLVPSVEALSHTSAPIIIIEGEVNINLFASPTRLLKEVLIKRCPITVPP